MVSLYYLTQTFQSSVWIYAQNPSGFSPDYVKPATDAPLLFSLYEFDIMFWPKEYVEQVGNLVLYKGTQITLHSDKERSSDLWFRAQFRRTFRWTG
jgi:hypothetical protein